jgi:hypothetical protein
MKAQPHEIPLDKQFKDAIENPKYAIEPHGDGYALYHGRSNFTHGFNLAHLTEISPETIKLIVDALNKKASEK